MHKEANELCIIYPLIHDVYLYMYMYNIML